MEYRSNDVSLPLLNRIQKLCQRESLEDLDSNAIHESRHDLYTLISHLNFILNSRVPINKLIPDILYYIFTYAIYTAEYHYLSIKTALTISHVCQRWRKCALGWPALWRFINIGNSPEIIQLFLCRSKDTPLDLCIMSRRITRKTEQKHNLKSFANRLRRLIVEINSDLEQLARTQDLLRHLNPELQPLQLQHLKIDMAQSQLIETMPLFTDIVHPDVTCLQSLYLDGVTLSFTKLPPNNRLTQFVFRPDYSPTLSQLLVFLSSCHLLRDLELEITFLSEPEIATPTSPLTVNRLDFPRLKRLELKMRPSSQKSEIASNILCHNYMRELSARIGTMGQLSYFSLTYDLFHWSDTTISPSHVFGLVPPETLSHFSNQVCLEFSVGSNTFSIDPPRWCQCPNPMGQRFILRGSWRPGERVDRAILEIIYSMPKIKHLRTHCTTLQRLVSWDVDFHDIFPCLDILELDFHHLEETMDILPKLKFKRLVLDYIPVRSSQLLPDAVSGTSVEVLELRHVIEDKFEWDEVVSTIRQTGVVVLLK